jgi:hypothetical protein
MSAEQLPADDRSALYDEAMSLLRRADYLLTKARASHELALFQAETNKQTVEAQAEELRRLHAILEKRA